MPTENLPLVSLIIPARNEAAYLPALLDSIIAGDYPLDRLEVLVVDGESTDGTPAIAMNYQDRLPNLHVISNPRKITPVAFNLGIQASHGEYIGILSGHSTISPNYVSETVHAFQRLPAACIGGQCQNVGQGFWGTVIARLISSPSFVGNAKFRYSQHEQRVDTLVGTFPREIFKRVGLFDERLQRNQDNDFSSRIRHAGGAIYLVPQLSFRYQVRSTLRGALRQFYGNGKWTIYASLVNRRAMSLRHFVPLGFVVGGVGALALAIVLRIPWIFVVPFVLYMLIVLRGIRGHGLTLRQRAAALVAQPLLHISYGVGSLVGIATLPGFLLRARKHPGIPRLTTAVPSSAPPMH